jgi:hypothetical protein
MESITAHRPTLVVAAGARAAEEALLDEVIAAARARDVAVQRAVARGESGRARDLLAAPLRIVVPSRSLREHVVAAITARAGRAVAALVVQTQWAVALEAIERAGEGQPRGDALFGVFVRRAARAEPVLADALGALRDGFGVVEASARDLADAGFEPAYADAALEKLAELRAAPGCERARAVVRTTARALAAMTLAGVAPRAALLQRAETLVALRGDALLPTRQLWIHGFADATGVVLDWLEKLQAVFGGRVVVDVPPDPADPAQREAAFAARFVEAMGKLAERENRGPAAPPQIARVRAAGATVELREVATRIRALIDDGVQPESIGVVARDPAALRGPLLASFARLAIPYSCHGLDAAPDARARRLAAWTRLVEDGGRAPTDAWLAASAHAADAEPDLRVALHVLGLGRLTDLAETSIETLLGDQSWLALPVRRGVEPEAEVDDAMPRTCGVRRRGLERDRIDAALGRARALVTALAAWPERAPFAEHRARVEALLADALGWPRDALLAALDTLADEVPDAIEVARDEAARVIGHALASAARRTAGGAGAGVAVLSAMQARGRTFDHLFVCGLVRDAFPIQPPIDPLFPDALRLQLQVVLPELPVKSRSRAEERHLFAELLSAAPHVTLSWSTVTDDGRECTASSFVERLGFERGDPELAGARPGLRRAHEAALTAALDGARAALVPIRRAALRESRAALVGTIDIDALATAQHAALAELDGDPTTRDGRARLVAFSPYLGRTGAITPAATLSITAIERIAACPWRHFLERELGLEAVPDALASLPALDTRLVGQVAHAVLERIATTAGCAARTTFADAERRGARRVPWPKPDALAALTLDVATKLAAADGVRSPLFARALAAAVAPLLEVVREIDWRDPEGPLVLGVELDGAIDVADGADVHRIAFRADRVDAAPGSFRVTDYKTGKPPSDAKTAKTLADHFRKRVAEGRNLQAAAYFVAIRDRAEAAVEGRFLYLRPEAEPMHREWAVARADADLVAHFEATVGTAARARAEGAFPPRLEDAKGQQPGQCESCDVAAACRVGESSARRRYREWLAQAPGAAAAVADERAAVGVLGLGAKDASRDGAVEEAR